MFNLVPWRRKDVSAREDALTPRASQPLARIREEVNALFDRFLADWPSLDQPWKGWPMVWPQDFEMGWGLTVDDREKDMVVRAEAPGFEADDFDVRLSGNQLVIRAEREEERKEGNGMTRRYGSLHRVVPLPQGIEEQQIQARYHNGILEVTIPKGEAARAKRITVKPA